MIVRLRSWFVERSLREQRLLLLMAAIAMPLLLWLLVVRPVGLAYDQALDRHLEAIDRNARVRALAETDKVRAVPGVAIGPDVALAIAERAARAGLVLDSNSAAGSNGVVISVSSARATVVTQWLAELERDGFMVSELRMAPAADGQVSLSARLARNAR